MDKYNGIILLFLILLFLYFLNRKDRREKFVSYELMAYRKPQYHAHINEYGKAIWVDTVRPDLRGDYSCNPMDKCPAGMDKDIMCWRCQSVEFQPQFKSEWYPGATYLLN
jgi:hypothetical protein